MRNARRFIIVSISMLLAAGLAGCTSRRPVPANAAAQSRQHPPATSPADVKAQISLDQIEPQPELPPPATLPSEAAPLESLELFASARAAILERQRHTAISLLERAIALDPYSFELYFALGQAHLPRGETVNDQSIAAFEKAAAIDPGNLDVRVQLGRQYLSKEDRPKAIQQFRLALLSPQYGDDEDLAAIIDFFLARALQDEGYDRAALQCYGRLIQRLQRPTMAMRANPELAILISRPELLFTQMGELHEKHGELEQALEAYQLAAEGSPGVLDFHARVIRVLIASGRHDDAAQRATDVLKRFRASPESLALVREVYEKSGEEEELVRQLRRLRAEQPDDQAILFALTDVLIDQGERDEAGRLLRGELEASDYDIGLVQRLYAFHEEADDVDAAAKLLIEALAKRPESRRQLAPLWNELLRPSRKNRLRLSHLQTLAVDEPSQASKLYWISQVAELWQRDMVARSALEQAAALKPPFAPAYRDLVLELWSRSEWDQAQKLAATQKLIDSANAQGAGGLAAEVRGLALLAQQKPRDAANAFADAIKMSKPSAELQFTYASALQLAGDNSRFEQILWKLLGDYPAYEDAYSALFRHYLEDDSIKLAAKVLKEWRAADPASVTARVLEASFLFQARQPRAAELVLQQLFEEDSENLDVLSTMRWFYTQTGQLDRLISLLEEQHAGERNNRAVVEVLIDVYSEQNRLAEALRVLDSTRSAVVDDPDLLYYVAHLYTRIGQQETTEQILQQVVQIDPNHAPASNDLGYSWADQGKNLPRAEELIRTAVKAEPDNQSFLDSMGWVLYKRGRFDEARKYLEDAIGPARYPDPVVLDHFGDVLYRLGEGAKAQAQWEQSLKRLGEVRADRDDLRQLKLQLQKKLQQAGEGQPVNVAPVVEMPAAPVQAKS